MFTTGSKLFIGGTALATVGAVLYGTAHGGKLGTVALVGAIAALALLAGVTIFTRDGNQPSLEPGATTIAAAAQPPVRSSIWPLIAALGAGLLIVGAQTRPAYFKLGIIVLLAAGAEWLVQSWAERGTGDAAYNNRLRKVLMNPFEFPLIAAVGLGAIIYSFSRIMLWVDKSGAVVVFGVFAALAVVGGYLIASRSSLQKGLVTGVAAVIGLGLVATGATMALDGQREIEAHPTTTANPGVCSEAGADAEVDTRSPGDVGMISSPAAIIVVEGGKIAAFSQGLEGARPDVTLTAGNYANLIFRNRDKIGRRFTVNMGTFLVDNAQQVKRVCTTLIRPGEEQLLTLRFAKPQAASLTPYTITVPGLDDQAISVLVP